jgi:hypothetical protein
MVDLFFGLATIVLVFIFWRVFAWMLAGIACLAVGGICFAIVYRVLIGPIGG